MKWLQVGLACIGLAAASYAWAAPPEGGLGRSLALEGARPASGKATTAVALGAAASRADGSPVRYGKALAGLKPESRSATRGANETRVYQAASPSVVLVVAEDGLGSGVLISADGRIVTNLHVVGDAAEVGVIYKPILEGGTLKEAQVHRAKVLRRDEVADLALIQVSDAPSHAKPLTIATGMNVQVGADVHAIGHPTGEAWTYTRGIVSQVRRDYAWTTELKLKHQATVIQTQTPINPGNSGGPLIDDALNVVGINSFVGDGEGLNYAVSADDVRAFLAREGDRTAERPKAADCKVEAVSERPSDDPKGMEFLIDADCDGQGDYIAIVPDDKREGLTLMFDDDGDGKIDSVEFDKNRDGHPEAGLYDTNADGKFDLEGKFRNNEDEPYRYDRIKD